MPDDRIKLAEDPNSARRLSRVGFWFSFVTLALIWLTFYIISVAVENQLLPDRQLLNITFWVEIGLNAVSLILCITGLLKSIQEGTGKAVAICGIVLSILCLPSFFIAPKVFYTRSGVDAQQIMVPAPITVDDHTQTPSLATSSESEPQTEEETPSVEVPATVVQPEVPPRNMVTVISPDSIECAHIIGETKQNVTMFDIRDVGARSQLEKWFAENHVKNDGELIISADPPTDISITERVFETIKGAGINKFNLQDTAR